jgi:DNA (cytosine-5)-methyltransferase 1
MSTAFTYGSLFTGIGGWDLAADRAGMRCLFQVEIDPVCRSVLARHWPDVERFEDVCDVGAHNLPPVDVILFSAPCQDLSVAGKRAGLDGARSGLYFEATRIIRELRPALALFEQVPGLLSSHGGRDFGLTLDALADIGALDIGWSVLDARYWRVAQRRRRLYVVSDFRANRGSQILSLADGLSGHPAPGREERQGAPARADGSTGSGGAIVSPVAATLNSSRPGERGYRNDADTAENLIAIPIQGDERSLVTGMTVRRLTPTECSRLQAYPDGWIPDTIADSHHYRLLGNSVCVAVVEWLMRRVVAAMSE